MRVLLKRDHNPGCFYRDGSTAQTPWVLDSRYPTFYGSKRGGNRGSTYWVRMRCNDPRCEALVLIHHWDLADRVEAIIDQGRP
jgi:hypothetical protein